MTYLCAKDMNLTESRVIIQSLAVTKWDGSQKLYDQLERTGVAIVGWWIVLVGCGDMSWGPHGALCQEFFLFLFFFG